MLFQQTIPELLAPLIILFSCKWNNWFRRRRGGQGRGGGRGRRRGEHNEKPRERWSFESLECVRVYVLVLHSGNRNDD